MRVGLVTQPADAVLPPRQNSIGLIMYHTAVQLAGSVDVSLIVKRRQGTSEARSLPFDVEPIDSPWDDRLGELAGRYPRWAGRLGIREVADRYPDYARRVSGILRRRTCNVAHVMNYWQWCRQLRRDRCAVVLEMQSEWLSQMDRRSVEMQLAAADAVVGVSEHIVNLFKESFPGYRGLVATAYNGVDTGVFRPADGQEPEDRVSARRILFVGRISPEKGVHVLIEAFAQIAHRLPDVVLDLAGPRTILPSRLLVDVSAFPMVRGLRAYYDGTVTRDYQRHLDELVTRYGIVNKVQFLGSLPHDQLVSRYQDASLVVNPSYSESFGISVVEGMASGVPVVGTRVGGMQETIQHGETGLLVEPGESESLAQAMIQLLEDVNGARQMGVKGRRRVMSQFSWEARADRLVDVYRRVAS